MRFLDYIRYGLKNIWRQKARTILTIIAVMIGATSVVLMLTIIFGAKTAAISQIESAGALTQVTVSGNTNLSGDSVFRADPGGGGSDRLKLTDEVLTKVKAIPHVTTAYAQLSAYQLGNGGTITDEKGTRVNFSDIQTVAYEPGATTQQLVAGRDLAIGEVNSIVIGQEALNALGLKGKASEALGKVLTFGVQGYVGDDKSIPLPPDMSHGPVDREVQDNYFKEQQQHITSIPVTIVGVMTAGVYDQQNFVPMALAKKSMTMNQWQQKEQKNLSCPPNSGPCNPPKPEYFMSSNSQFDQQGYSTFVLKVDELANVDGVAAAAKNMSLGAATAKEVIDQILQIFKMVSIVFGAIGGISLFVAAIGVINTMVMATLERTREIGVMRACGATRAAVRRLFTFEAALLGFWGGLFGCAIAYAASAAAVHFLGSELSKQNVPLSVLNIPIWLGLTTIATTTVVGMLAGYWPAVRAARMNPVEALRYE